MMSTATRPYVNATSDQLRCVLATHLPTIRAVVRVVSRRHGCRGEEEADLLSEVFLHLMKDDYAVLRKFRGTSSLQTYLRTVACRVLLDRRIAAWGKWRPTAKAKALGASARQLERLVVRDHFTPQEAIGVLTHSPGTNISYDAAVRLCGDLRLRLRAQRISLDEAASRLGAWPEDHLTSLPDLPRRADMLARALRRALGTLEPGTVNFSASGTARAGRWRTSREPPAWTRSFSTGSMAGH
jgi:hypothetical protein